MFLVCGEALMDMLPRTLADGNEAYLSVPGGANTAIALGRLGEETGYFSGISTDMFGQRLIDHLEEDLAGLTPDLRVESEISRYTLREEDKEDVLRIYYKRARGSLLPESKTFRLGRVHKTVVADSGAPKYAEGINCPPFCALQLVSG